MKFLSHTVWAAALVAGIAGPVWAAPVSISSTATIRYEDSIDGLGLFGTPGASMVNKLLTITWAFDTADNAYNQYSPSSFSRSYGNAPVRVSVEIDGRSFSTTIVNNSSANFSIFNELSTLGSAGDGVQAYAEGSDALGRSIHAGLECFSYSAPFVGSSSDLTVRRTFSNALCSSSSWLDLEIIDGTSRTFLAMSSYGVGSQSISMNNTVPEPGTLALVCLGLLPLVGTGRQAALRRVSKP